MRRVFFSRWISSPALLWINVAVVLLLGMSFGREYIRNQQIQRTIAALEIKEVQLSSRNREIASLNRELETGLYLEREARSRLGLVKPGERVVILPSPEGERMVPDIGGEKIPDTNTGALPPVPQRWWLYITDPAAFDTLRLSEQAKL